LVRDATKAAIEASEENSPLSVAVRNDTTTAVCYHLLLFRRGQQRFTSKHTFTGHRVVQKCDKNSLVMGKYGFPNFLAIFFVTCHTYLRLIVVDYG
jgi:hypothetical protein